MEITIKFSTGKEITLTQSEYNELMGRQPVYTPYYPYPYYPTWTTSDATTGSQSTTEEAIKFGLGSNR